MLGGEHRPGEIDGDGRVPRIPPDLLDIGVAPSIPELAKAMSRRPNRSRIAALNVSQPARSSTSWR